MKKLFSKALDILKHPRGWSLFVFYILFACTLAAAIAYAILAPKQTILCCVCYALAAAGLAYFVYTIIYLVPKIKNSTVRAMRRHTFTANLLDDYGFRTIVFAAVGFVVNIGYALLQTIVGIVARSIWYIAVAAFYFVLIALKGIAFLGGKRAKNNFEKTRKVYLVCGCLLFLLAVTLIGIVILTNKTNMNFEYAGVMIYAAAAYTFYKIIAAAVQFSKAKQRGGLVVQALRNFNLADALYSVFVLQVAMIRAFGSTHDAIANNITGAAVALLISGIGLFMIVKSHTLKPPPDGDGES